MPATYDPLSGEDKDLVRLLSGDRDVAHAKLDDEEIFVFLREEPNAYYAAARACGVILAKSGGLVMKEVGDLRLQWSNNAENAYTKHASSLREEGARRLLSGKREFKTLGS